MRATKDTTEKKPRTIGNQSGCRNSAVYAKTADKGADAKANHKSEKGLGSMSRTRVQAAPRRTMAITQSQSTADQLQTTSARLQTASAIETMIDPELEALHADEEF